MNCHPMTPPTRAPPRVEVKPCSEAPMPATEATGSMAMAPKLEVVKAKHAMAADCKATKIHNCSSPRAAIAACKPVMAM